MNRERADEIMNKGREAEPTDAELAELGKMMLDRITFQERLARRRAQAQEPPAPPDPPPICPACGDPIMPGQPTAAGVCHWGCRDKPFTFTTTTEGECLHDGNVDSYEDFT